ncbi:MAG TPA: HypC/HybG/HupF family hydrogenase formation chaperone [Thermoplasmata archaeon]|nr:HypC/HybG/HupF family hydrogenase formation chaperone [Thermoplasmata archaeon]
MCLATPGRIVRIAVDDPRYPVAEVDFGSVVRPAQLVYVPDARVGDYVIVQAGFAIRRMSEREAEESLRYARELAALSGSSAGPAPAPPERAAT